MATRKSAKPHAGELVVKAAKGLNLRVEPNRTAQVIQVLPDGAALQLLDVGQPIKGWTAVRTGEDRIGWVDEKYIGPAEADGDPDGE